MSHFFIVKASLALSTVVQTAKSNVSASGTAVSVTFNAPVTAGNTLIAAVGMQNNAQTISTVKDNINSPNWTQAVLKSANNQLAAIYYYNSTLAGTPAVTLTFASNPGYNMEIAIIEVSGLSGGVDVSSSNTGNTAGTASPGSLTTTGANRVLVAYHVGQAGTQSGASGWTYTQLPTTQDGFEYIVAATAGTYNPNFTVTGTTFWSDVAAAFK